MEEKDIEGVAKLYRENFPEHVFIEILSDPEKWKQQLKDENKFWLVTEDKESGEIVGCAGLEVNFLNSSAEIERVVVAKPFRNKGISKMMCEALVDVSEKLGINYVYAWVRGAQPAMQRTFLRLNFRDSVVVPPFVVLYNGNRPRESMNEEREPRREEFVFMYKLLKDDRADYTQLLEAIRLKKEIEEIIRELYDPNLTGKIDPEKIDDVKAKIIRILESYKNK
ncbi:MAG: GNAT family N-acetyltransferase [Candidatus Aenigmatarchaeota archaeon]